MIEDAGEYHGVLALLRAAIRVSEVPHGMRAEDAARHRRIVTAMGGRKLPVAQARSPAAYADGGREIPDPQGGLPDHVVRYQKFFFE
jgi:hypothetical protein